jgi:hypothetical protein
MRERPDALCLFGRRMAVTPGGSITATRPRRRRINAQLSLVAGPESCWTGQMTRSSGQPARRSAARLTRTLRTGWWPRFLLAGVLLVVVGATFLSGAAQAVAAGLGALVIYVTAVWSLSLSPGDYRRERPVYAVRSTWAVERRGAASPAPKAGRGRSPGPAEPAQQPRRPGWRWHYRGPVRRWRACAVDEQASGAKVRHLPQRGRHGRASPAALLCSPEGHRRHRLPWRTRLPPTPAARRGLVASSWPPGTPWV